MVCLSLASVHIFGYLYTFACMLVTLHVFYTLSCRLQPHQCLSLRREESDVCPLTLQAPLASGSDACLVNGGLCVCKLCGRFKLGICVCVSSI